MDKLETFLRCVELSKTVCEAFKYLKENMNSEKNFNALLTDVQSGLSTILLKLPILLGEGQEDFREKTVVLLKNCEKYANIRPNTQLFRAFDEWNHARIAIFYIAAINKAVKSEGREEAAASLLESILNDNAAKNFEPIIDYVLSQVLKRREPLRAYQLGIKAFELDNRLSKNIVRKEAPAYHYVYKRAEEDYFENCPICHGTGTPFFCAAQVQAINFDPMFSPMRLWMKCDSCGQLYTYNFPKKMVEPQPEAEELGDEAYMQPKLGLLSLFGDILKRTATFTNGNKLLDIGAGSGELIAAALELGFDSEGIEISKRQAQRLKALLGVKIHCTDFLDFDTAKKYDIITMGDVIEHVTDPLAALKKANELLVENGVLWISTPNYESGFSRIRGFSDPMWLEPYHITYFCFKGFKKFLSNNGFEVLDYSISNRYNGSMEIIAKKCGV